MECVCANIVICGLSGSTVLFHIILINGMILGGGGRGEVIEHEMHVLVFSTTLT